MKPDTIINGIPVSLPEILNARENRACRQHELLAMFVSDTDTCSLISFSMNIAGEVKSFPLALAAFDEGIKELRTRIPAKKILHFEESGNNTGPEAFFVLSMNAQQSKRLTTAIEESHPLGRLFDMDVLEEDGRSISRSSLGLSPRTCLICDGNAKACARSRSHSIEMVLWRTAQILNDFFREQAADKAASCAVRALLYEVSATPKPGLVDRNNSGSHKDMDFFTFLDSSSALIPRFRDFFCIGWEHSAESEEQLFFRLRYAGQQAETEMFSATGGINTHKGLIFASAILLGALGKTCSRQIRLAGSTEVLAVCRRLGQCALEDFNTRPQTPGEQFHSHYGITGARGEAAAGFPSALTCGLPALKHWLQQGFGLNDSTVLALISLLAQVDDTNMIHRGGLEQANKSKADARLLLSEISPDTFKEKLAALDASYIEKNLSPGGCADLLAVSLMFLFLENSGMITPVEPVA